MWWVIEANHKIFKAHKNSFSILEEELVLYNIHIIHIPKRKITRTVEYEVGKINEFIFLAGINIARSILLNQLELMNFCTMNNGDEKLRKYH